MELFFTYSKYIWFPVRHLYEVCLGKASLMLFIYVLETVSASLFVLDEQHLFDNLIPTDTQLWFQQSELATSFCDWAAVPALPAFFGFSLDEVRIG